MNRMGKHTPSFKHSCVRHAFIAVVAIAGSATVDAKTPRLTAARSATYSVSPRASVGFLQPWESIEVAVSQPGRLADVIAKDGATVSAGDAIARLDDAVLRASLEVAKQRASAMGEAESARARLNHAAKRHEDLTALFDESHASQTEVDQAELVVREAESALLAAQEKIDIAAAEVARIEAQIESHVVRSPIDGVVIEMKRRKGEYAAASDPVIAKIAILKQLRLRLNVPTKLAFQLQPEQQVRLQLSELERVVDGKIDFVSPITDSESGTVRVDIRINNYESKLRSGLLATWNWPEITPSR